MPTSTNWSLTLHTQCVDMSPHTLIGHIIAITPVSKAVAQYPWYDVAAITAWAGTQVDAVLTHTLATTRRAQQANVDAIDTMRQVLANLLSSSDISVDALEFAAGALKESCTNAPRLAVLATTLQEQCAARALQVPDPMSACVAFANTTDLVINRISGLTRSDPNAFAQHITAAMATVELVHPMDDVDSPFEELMAVFTQEYHPNE